MNNRIEHIAHRVCMTTVFAMFVLMAVTGKDPLGLENVRKIERIQAEAMVQHRHNQTLPCVVPPWPGDN